MKINFEKNQEKQSIKSYTVIIPNPPDFIYVEISKKVLNRWIKKKTKKYLTANVWYGSSGTRDEVKHRMEIKKKSMWFLHSCVHKIPKFIEFPLKFTYTYYHSSTTFDLQNKLYFWAKLFEDYLVDTNKIPDDNVNYITSEHYEFIKSEEKKLIIKIEVIT